MILRMADEGADVAAPESYAYLCIAARRSDARGDRIIDELLVTPDKVKRRGENWDDGRVRKTTRAMLSTPNVAPDELGNAVADLVERLRPHTAAFRALQDDARIWLAIVAEGLVGPWQIRLCPHAVAWLAEIGARLWIDTFGEAPAGTEDGPVCGFCGLVRPATDSEPLVDLLNGWGPYDGVADARIVICSLDYDEACAITQHWEYLYAPLDDLGVIVLAGRPHATGVRRDGAVAVPILLRRLRANRPVRRALRRGNPSAVEIRVRHWTNTRRAGAWLLRRDLRRMAKLGAMFFYQIVPDRKPSFNDLGKCNHCDYVQPWSKDVEPLTDSAPT